MQTRFLRWTEQLQSPVHQLMQRPKPEFHRIRLRGVLTRGCQLSQSWLLSWPLPRVELGMLLLLVCLLTNNRRACQQLWVEQFMFVEKMFLTFVEVVQGFANFQPESLLSSFKFKVRTWLWSKVHSFKTFLVLRLRYFWILRLALVFVLIFKVNVGFQDETRDSTPKKVPPPVPKRGSSQAATVNSQDNSSKQTLSSATLPINRWVYVTWLC